MTDEETPSGESDLDDLLAEVWAAPAGPAREQAAARAVAFAEEHGDPGALLETRLLLAQARYHVPAEPSHLALHAWLIAQLDTDVPDADQRRTILWIGKWAMSHALDHPDVPLSVVTDLFADLERRVRLEGYSDRAVAEHRIWLGLRRGDSADQVAAAIARWQSTERDDLSDCLACEANAWGRLLELTGDLPGALAQWQPVIDGDLHCAEEPHRVLAHAADVLARVGRTSEAAAAHQRGWRLVRGRRTLSGAVGDQLMFLVRAGQPARALELLEPCQAWADELPDASAAMFFHAATAAVLTAAAQDRVAPAQFGDEDTTAARDRHAAAAEELVGRFVARNGATWVADRLWERVDPTPYEQVVRLSGLGAPLPGPTVPPEPTGPAGSGPSRSGAPSPEAPVTSAEVLDLAAAVRRARDLGDLERGRLLTRWSQLRRTLPPVGTTVNDAQHEGDEDGQAAAVRSARSLLDRWLALDRARPEDPLWDEALRAAEATGDADEVALTACHRAAEYAVAGEPAVAEAAAGEAADLAATLEIRGAVAQAAEAHRAVARLDGPDRLAHVDRAIALSTAAGDQRSALVAKVEALRYRADLDPAGAREGAASLIEEAIVAGHLRPELEARSLLALLIARDAEDLGAAEREFEAVAARAESAGIATPMVALVDRAWVAATAGEPELLQEAAEALVDGATHSGHPGALALGRYRLGQAAMELADPLGAVLALEPAAATWRERRNDLLGPTMWLLGHALAELGDLGPAAEAFRESARAAERSGETEAAGEAWWQAGVHQLQADGESGVADLDRALAVAVETGDPDLELRARRAAASAVGTDDPHAAVAHLDALVARLPEWVIGELLAVDVATQIRISVERQAAECYARAGEWAAALDRIRTAEAQCGVDHPDELRAAESERAMYLAASGRVDEALALLVPLLPDLEMVDLYPALAAVCRALAEIDREDEGDQLWAEWIDDDEDDELDD